jgi:hypothetical protein
MMPYLNVECSLSELEEQEAPVCKPPRINYTHQDMVDFILANPGVTQREVARRYGYTESWVSQILASDAMQEFFAARRKELLDPALAASIEERFRALTIRSLQVLQGKLDAPQVEANVALRCAELGAKSLGIGGHAPPAPPPAEGDPLERLAERLYSIQRKGVINGTATRIEERAGGEGGLHAASPEEVSRQEVGGS